jgi:hypothetical protein
VGTAFDPVSRTRVPPRKEFGISAIRSTSSTSAQALGRRITLHIDLTGDLCRDSRISGEVATRAYPDPPQRNTGRLRLPEQIVGHAPRNGQVQQLATVQAKPAAASASRTVDDDGVRTGRTDRRRLVV